MTKKRRPPKRSSRQRPNNAPIDLTLDGMAHGGSAVGRFRNRPVFVPYTIPGERVKAQITRHGKGVDFAVGVQLLAASGDRVFPQCAHFGQGQCWGCQWQHIDYNAQLLLKQEILGDQLSRLGKLPDKVIADVWRSTIPSPNEWHYNHHMTLHRTQDGAWGLMKVNGRQVEPISECWVMHPDLWTLFETIDWDFDTVSAIKLQLGSDGETMVQLHLTEEQAPELQADFPTSVNVILPDNEPMNLVGDAIVTYRILDHDFRVTAGSYFRANIAQLPTLVQLVLDFADLQGTETILELYSGGGLLTAFLAQHCDLITSVESYPPAVTDAEGNTADFEHVNLVEGSVQEVLQAYIEDQATADVVVVDPPSRGLGADVVASLAKLGAKRLVYLSSDPASLAKDVRNLRQAGYRLETTQPIDLAPQTYYVDSVSLLTHK